MIDGDKAQIFALVAAVLALIGLLISPFFAFVCAAAAAAVGFKTKDEVGFPLFAQVGMFGGAGIAALIVVFSIISWVWGSLDIGGVEKKPYTNL